MSESFCPDQSASSVEEEAGATATGSVGMKAGSLCKHLNNADHPVNAVLVTVSSKLDNNSSSKEKQRTALKAFHHSFGGLKK